MEKVVTKRGSHSHVQSEARIEMADARPLETRVDVSRAEEVENSGEGDKLDGDARELNEEEQPKVVHQTLCLHLCEKALG